MTKAGANGRVSPAEALRLLTDAPTAELVQRADAVRRRLHGRRTYFVHSLNVNPTNICRNRCDLCAFWRDADDDDAYLLTVEQVRRQLAAARDLQLTDVHIVGGLTDQLDLAYYESIIRAARELLPDAFVQGMTATEIDNIARIDGLEIDTVLQRLADAGMGSLSGGGAEIFAADVRDRICPEKLTAERWLAVHARAHALGLPTNATMLFGHLESDEQIVDHLCRLRDQQDASGGFQAFIPLPFHPDGARVPVANGPFGDRIVRVVAAARIVLDNFPHIRVLANYMDRKLLGVCTHSGADDVGGTSLAEQIALAAGAATDRAVASITEMAAMLAELGLDGVLVDSAYNPAPLPRSAPTVMPVASPAVDEALVCAESGERLSAEQAAALHEHATVGQLGAAAHRRRLSDVPGSTVTFVIDRNISVTNVCEAGCRFCAFHVDPSAEGAFTLSIDEILQKVTEATDVGATQVLLQGGLNPELDLSFYERMLAAIKQRCDVWLHSLSPAEVLYLARRADLSIERTLQRLRDAGLDSLPGGGAEILVDDVRRRVSPRKIAADQWFDVMRTAQRLGLKTTATMVYGLGETVAQRVEHLLRIRQLQDETGGFTAFIPWSFQPDNTQMPGPKATGVDYLRIVALARLVLDNIPHIQAGWVTEGPDLAQLALSFGADDFGGVLMEERVVRAAGVAYTISVDTVLSLIREASMAAAQRTTQYEILRTDAELPGSLPPDRVEGAGP